MGFWSTTKEILTKWNKSKIVGTLELPLVLAEKITSKAAGVVDALITRPVFSLLHLVKDTITHENTITRKRFIEAMRGKYHLPGVRQSRRAIHHIITKENADPLQESFLIHDPRTMDEHGKPIKDSLQFRVNLETDDPALGFRGLREGEEGDTSSQIRIVHHPEGGTETILATLVVDPATGQVKQVQEAARSDYRFSIQDRKVVVQKRRMSSENETATAAANSRKDQMIQKDLEGILAARTEAEEDFQRKDTTYSQALEECNAAELERDKYKEEQIDTARESVREKQDVLTYAQEAFEANPEDATLTAAKEAAVAGHTNASENLRHKEVTYEELTRRLQARSEELKRVQAELEDSKQKKDAAKDQFEIAEQMRTQAKRALRSSQEVDAENQALDAQLDPMMNRVGLQADLQRLWNPQRFAALANTFRAQDSPIGVDGELSQMAREISLDQASSNNSKRLYYSGRAHSEASFEARYKGKRITVLRPSKKGTNLKEFMRDVQLRLRAEHYKDLGVSIAVSRNGLVYPILILGRDDAAEEQTAGQEGNERTIQTHFLSNGQIEQRLEDVEAEERNFWLKRMESASPILYNELNEQVQQKMDKGRFSEIQKSLLKLQEDAKNKTPKAFHDPLQVAHVIRIVNRALMRGYEVNSLTPGEAVFPSFFHGKSKRQALQVNLTSGQGKRISFYAVDGCPWGTQESTTGEGGTEIIGRIPQREKRVGARRGEADVGLVGYSYDDIDEFLNDLEEQTSTGSAVDLGTPLLEETGKQKQKTAEKAAFDRRVGSDREREEYEEEVNRGGGRRLAE